MIKPRPLTKSEAKLLEENDILIRGLTKKAMRKVPFKNLTYEEYLSYGYQTAIAIVKSYDETKGTKFSTYLFKYFIRYFFRYLNQCKFNNNLDSIVEEQEPQDSQNEEFKYTFNKINKVLTEKQMQMLLLYSNGFTNKEIGIITGTSKQNVNQIITRAIKVVKNKYDYKELMEGSI